MSKRAWSFRPLGIFWAAALGLLTSLAVGLQALGPADTKASVGKDSPVVSTPKLAAVAQGLAPAEKPAFVLPKVQNPVPLLKQASSVIPDPDPALQEPAADLSGHTLPRIADNGRTPAELYAAAFDPSERHPRVALVLDGGGLDRLMTEEAMRVLPSAIDIAFSAYAPPATADALADIGRHQGRECLLSIPMEPNGFPAAEEGDRSLLIGGDPAQNRQDLEWALSNVQGCVGATGGSDGLNGERFAQSRQAFGEMLASVEHRGLIYLDSRPGAAPGETALPGHLPPRVADVIVDEATAGEPADATAIDRNLAQLAKLALAHGAAIGLAGPPRPVLLDRITVWAQGLAAQGIVLAPLSAIPAPQTAKNP